MAGNPVYFYFGTPDSTRAKEFFGRVLDWEFEPGNADDGYNVTNISPAGGLFGGGDSGRGFRMYFEVDDLGAAGKKIADLGGRCGQPQPTDGGHFCDCSDDQGFEFGIWAPDAD
jgi:predicted enzyme related to lactoylglutathione lyase